MDNPTPQQTPPPSFEEDSLDLKKYFFLILANWYWFVISLFVGLAVAYLVNRYTMPNYRVSGSLMLNEGSPRSGLSGYEAIIPGMEIYAQRKFVVNEMEVLKSYSLAKRALEELDFGISYKGIGRSGLREVVMYKNCPFYVEIDSSRNNLTSYPVEIDLVSNTHYDVYIDDKYDIRERVEYGKPFQSGPFSFTLSLKNPETFTQASYNRYEFTLHSLNGLANRYKGKLGISTNDERRGSVLFLTLTENNSQKAADYLNTLMANYIKQGLEEKNQTATNTVEFIDQQLGIIDDSLQQAEYKLQNFRTTNSLLNISTEGQIIYSNLENLERRKAETELRARYYDYLQEYIKDKNNLNEIVSPGTMDIADPLLNSLITQLNELLNEKEELLYSIKGSSPQLNIINSKIANARGGLMDNINGLIENNQMTLNEINKQISGIEKELRQLPVTERKLIGIQRDYNVNDQIYTYLLEKRAEAAIAKASNVADNKILDIARTENAARISPNTRTNNMLGLLGGIGLPLALIILIELTNNKIAGRNDIESRTRIPIIAHIGHSEKGDIPVFENPKSSIAESFRGLRTNLQYLLRESDEKVITVTSTVSGEGKTYVSLNLSAIFAMAGKKTLLVGLDLRKPKVHKVFNVENETGLSSYLIKQTPYKDLVKSTEISNLYVVPSGPVPPNPAELLETKELENFISQARKEFEIVIVDTPPYGVVTDALLVGRHSDANLFLVRQNHSEKDVLELMNEIQVRQNLKNLGIVFNDLKLKGYYRSGYKYYNYNYTYRYGYIYGSDYYGKE